MEEKPQPTPEALLVEDYLAEGGEQAQSFDPETFNYNFGEI